MYVIYKLNIKETGKIYIGMTSRYSHRMRVHKSREFRGLHFSHEIICKTKDKETALELEKFWILKLKSNDQRFGYNKMIGKILPDSSKMKMSASQKMRKDRPFLGKKHSEETRKMMSDKKRGKVPSSSGWNKKRIKNQTTGEVFESINAACERYNLHKAAVSRCCLGKQKTSGGFVWSLL